ncbi:MAG TPA: FHA domain-containing protein, partial [Verrucomicrobiae bacterium]|nr:FHA domain-containing protein [Verrucomicrobiae bacterium]
PEAKAAIGAAEIELRELPYRVGRENRNMQWTDKGMRSERREPTGKPNNDLYLIEKTEPMNVSREHFQIERDGEGFALVDRKSTCGTMVEGDLVGGQNRGGRAALRDGDVIIVGASISPYVFKFKTR